MSYFKNFPKIPYEFVLDGKPVLINMVDIALNVRARKQALKNYAIYDEYDIDDGETPESISERLYGTPFHHWIIMLLNDRFDYVNDFPMSTPAIERYVTEKYGAGREFDQHVVNNQPTYLDRYGNTAHKLPLDMFASKYPSLTPDQLAEEYTRYGRTFTMVTNREFEDMANEKKRRIRVPNSAIIDKISAELVGLIQP